MMYSSILISLLIFARCRGLDDCHDLNGNKDSKGWIHLEKLNGLSVTIKDSNSTYKLGVCKNLLEDNESEHAGALEFRDNRTIIVGRYNESDLMYGTHWILLKYMGGDPYEDDVCGDSNRHAAIMFVCNHDAETLDTAKIIEENLNRDKNCYHLFEIENCVACISDGCSQFFYTYSPGTIILIGLFSLIAAYLIFGWIYTRVVRRRRGWKQIPNAAFWQEIGHLQADGCNMVCRCGSRPEDDYHIVAGESNINNPHLPPDNLMSDDDGTMLPP